MITSIQLSVILIRILSLYLILQGISILPAFYRVSSSEAFYLDPQYIIIVLGIIIWIFASPISRFMLGKESTPSDTINNFSINQFEILMFSTVGLVLVVHVIPQLFSLIIYRKAAATLASDPIIKVQALATFKSSLVYNTLKLFFGAYLLFFSKHLIESIDRFRNKIKRKI